MRTPLYSEQVLKLLERGSHRSCMMTAFMRFVRRFPRSRSDEDLNLNRRNYSFIETSRLRESAGAHPLFISML